jgi:hypothetical protein
VAQWFTATAPRAMRSVWKFFMTAKAPVRPPSRFPGRDARCQKISFAVSDDNISGGLTGSVPLSTMNIDIKCRAGLVFAATVHIGARRW